MPQFPIRLPVVLVIVALGLLFALPAFAGSTPDSQTPTAVAAGCQASASAILFGDLAPQSPAAAAQVPAWLDHSLQAGTTKFRRFCACGCSPIPDCNTSADCGGSPCLAGITCC